MKRREFLKMSLAGSGILLGGQMANQAQDSAPSSALALKGAIQNIHDPVMIKQDSSYYLFSTGSGIPVKRSDDMQHWKIAIGGPVFRRTPDEAAAYVPNAEGIWAPDISFYNGKYHLYYSVSTFGSNHSAIALATNLTLHTDADEYEWIDQGIVIQSDYPDDFNAIDANLVLDADDEPWLAFGSHWGGIKMIKLNRETGKQSSEDLTVYDLAARRRRPRAVEAPFIIYRGELYDLFVSFDQCCRGVDSTYNVRVGRSNAITGPYHDRAGLDMMNDGGTQITFASDRYRGPGHNAIYSEDGQDYIVYHAYDSTYGGTPTLRIHRLEWDEDGWPLIPDFQAQA